MNRKSRELLLVRWRAQPGECLVPRRCSMNALDPAKARSQAPDLRPADSFVDRGCLADHPALLAASDAADEVIPVFVLDDGLIGPSGPVRLAFLYGCLRDLSDRTGGALRVLRGRPEEVIAPAGAQSGAQGGREIGRAHV